MRVADFYAGFGGLSEAFLLAGDDVVRIDNNPLLQQVQNMQIEDVRHFRDHMHLCHAQGLPIMQCDVLLFGPPCREFSNGYSSPKSIHVREHGIESYEPSMEDIECCIDLVRIIKPRYWLIENVVGSIRYFKELGLEPRQIHGPHVLYGNFPLFDCPPFPTKASKDVHSKNPLRANHKALVPLVLSQALRRAIVEQKTLYCDY